MLRERRSVLYSWIVSYILILMIPVVAVCINYRNDIRVIKEGLLNFNELAAQNLRNVIDTDLQRAQFMFRQVYYNDNFSAMLSMTRKDGRFYQKAYELVSDLQDTQYADPDSAYVLIYFPGTDYIVTVESANDSEVYYRALRYATGETDDYNTWMERITKGRQGSFSVYSGLYLSKNDKYLSYSGTVRDYNGGLVNILVGVPMSQIAEVTESLEEGSYLEMALPDGDAAAFSEGEYVYLPVPDASAPYSMRQEKDLIFSCPSLKAEGITYSLAMTESFLDKSLEPTRRVFRLSLCVTLAFGFMGVCLLSVYNYLPVLELSRRFHLPERATDNEFKRFAKEYERIENENRKMHVTVKRQREALATSRLLSLMKGRRIQGGQEKWENMDETGSIALVGFMLPVERKSDAQYDELLFFTVNNVFSELMEGKTFWHAEDGQFIFYLFDLASEDEAQWEADVTEKAEYLCGFLLEHWNVPLICVISGIAEGLTYLHSIYQNVMEVFNYQDSLGGSGAFSTRMLEGFGEEAYIREYLQTEFSVAIKNGNQDGAKSAWDKLMDLEGRSSFLLQRMYAFDIFHLVMENFRVCVPNRILQEKAMGYVDPLLRAENRESLEECFDRLLSFTCGEINRKIAGEGKDIVRQVRKYVELHYSEQELNVGSLAEALGRNPRYIARVFSEEMGEGLLDYINRYRVDQAIGIMRSRKCRLEEIAASVGFTNINTFRRAFVKHAGEMPSKFYEKL